MKSAPPLLLLLFALPGIWPQTAIRPLPQRWADLTIEDDTNRLLKNPQGKLTYAGT